MIATLALLSIAGGTPPPVALPVTVSIASPIVAVAAPDRRQCDDRPVIMVIEGDIKDRERLAAYATAIRASGLYPRLGGYYLINPGPVAVFEGASPPTRSVLAVRFPCFAHARAFWYSRG